MIYAVTYSHNRHETDPMCILCNLQTFAEVCGSSPHFAGSLTKTEKNPELSAIPSENR